MICTVTCLRATTGYRIEQRHITSLWRVRYQYTAGSLRFGHDVIFPVDAGYSFVLSQPRRSRSNHGVGQAVDIHVRVDRDSQPGFADEIIQRLRRQMR